MDLRKKLSVNRKSFLLSCWLMWATCPLSAQIIFGGTTDTLGSECYQLTGLTAAAGGYVYEQTPLNLNQSFDLSYDVWLGDNDNGADGIVFVLRGGLTGSLIGSSGGSIGFSGSGFTSNSFGIEIDTWQNGDYGDPVEDHIGIFRNGPVDHTASNSLAGPVPALSGGGNMEDGENHGLRVTWNPNTDVLRVYLDCSLRISLEVDLIDDVFNGDNLVHWGFLGTTGGGFNEQGFCGPQAIGGFNNNLTAFLLCPGDSVQLEAGDSSVAYLWSPIAGLSDSTSNAPWASPLDSTTYVVRKISGCDTAFDSVDVNIFPFVLDLLSDTSICASSFTIEGPVGAEFYLWNTGDTTPNITIDTAGNYSLVASSGVCIDTDYVFIDMAYLQNEWLDTVLCEGELSLSVYNPNGTTLWSTGDTLESIDITEGGLYAVTLTLQDCVFEDSIDVRFRAVSVILPEDTTFCGPAVIQATLSGSGQLEWNTGDTGSSISVDSSGIRWLSFSNDWCSDADTAFIRVESFALVDTFLLLCDEVNTTLSAPMNEPWKYQWSTADTTASIVVNQSGVYDITVESAFCTFTDAMELVLSTSPMFELGDDIVLCAGQEAKVTPIPEWEGMRWSTGEVASSILIADTGFLVAEASYEGCLYRDSIYVSSRSLNPDDFFVVGNVLTPNADGLNDALRLELADPSVIDSYRLSVFNRWGGLIFESTFLNNGWDGAMPNGSPAPNGTYFYLLQAETTCDDLPVIEVRDNLTLLR